MAELRPKQFKQTNWQNKSNNESRLGMLVFQIDKLKLFYEYKLEHLLQLDFK